MRDANDRSLWVGDDVIYIGSGKRFAGTIVSDLGEGRCRVRVERPPSDPKVASKQPPPRPIRRSVSCSDLMRALARPVAV
jgi:hypothetical protein